MWGGLEKILEHVTSYSTNAGKVWYLIVFVFRLIIVVTVGQSVYSDEQSAFRCSTKVIGCDNVCYDKFSKISHIRYWSFQLLAVTAPAVVFHFYSLNVRGRIEKVKAVEEDKKNKEDGVDEKPFDTNPTTTDDELKRARAARLKKRQLRRMRSVRNFKEKPVFKNTNFEHVTWTRSIRAAYLINVALRIVIEIISLYVAYALFHFVDYTATASYNPLAVILIKVPQVYLCEGENVEWACGQHLSLGKTPGYVPCWVSRPWEKTIFMCYMNILSAFCCILSCIEFVQLSHRYITNTYKKRADRTKVRERLRSTRLSENPPVFLSVDETDGPRGGRTPHTAITIEDHRNEYLSSRPVKASRRPSRLKRKNFVDSEDLGVLVPYKLAADRERPKDAGNRPPSRTRFKTEKKKPVGITVHGDDSDNYSQPSFHSSRYRSGSSDEGEESRKSVSIRSAPDS